VHVHAYTEIALLDC